MIFMLSFSRDCYRICLPTSRPTSKCGRSGARLSKVLARYSMLWRFAVLLYSPRSLLCSDFKICVNAEQVEELKGPLVLFEEAMRQNKMKEGWAASAGIEHENICLQT
jgi:hypothetical protein